MPSAFRDARGWIADFRPLNAPKGKRRRVRVPDAQIPSSSAKAKAAATAYALECDRYCRMIERDPTPAAVRHAQQIGAITADQAEALLAGKLPELNEAEGPLTLKAAADSHPATRREMISAPAEYQRHSDYLDRFVAWSGIRHVEELTLEKVQAYIDHMRQIPWSWHTRRHALMFIRRASRMGANEGIPDPLYGFQLDRNEGDRPIDVWTLEELAGAAAGLEHDKDLRALVAIALGGFLGLRPSEMARVRVEDIKEGILTVGAREAKNATSRRRLPLPPTVRGWIERHIKGLPAERPIISPAKRINRKAFAEYDRDGLRFWLSPILQARTGRRLPVKCLRKSFATWMIESGAEERLVDIWIGHTVGTVSAVTARHYYAAAGVEKLRKLADLIEDRLQVCLHAKPED